MNDLALSVRAARPEDAADLARIYIEAWHDTYAGIIRHTMLQAMSHKAHTARLAAAIKNAERNQGAVLVAQDAHHGAIGLCSLGPARDKALGLDGEVYTLYVAPSFLGRGAGRALLTTTFEIFKAHAMSSCVIWAHARNNACFFYEAMGGMRVATRTTRLFGEPTPEIGFGWRQLAAQKQARTLPS